MSNDASGAAASSTSVKLTDTTRPFEPTLRVEDARTDYLAENGFDVAEYTSPTFRLKLLGRYFDVRNTPDRQWAIPLHDLHHLATGYGTDFLGEAEIGAWELRAGCETFIVYYLNSMAVLFGLFLSPRRVLAAFRAAKGARSLYRAPLPMDQALSMRLGDLRSHLGVPRSGIANDRRLHEDAQRDREAQISRGELASASA